MNPLLKAFMNELDMLGLDLEYRGDGLLYPIGDKELWADQDIRTATASAKPRIVAHLKPLWDQGGGKPVRLSQVAQSQPAEPVHRPVPQVPVCGVPGDQGQRVQ